MARLFLDTEFTELRQQARLLSLALVGEDEEWFYAVFTDVDVSSLSEWHQENVVPYLELSSEQLDRLPRAGRVVKGATTVVTDALKEWLANYEQLEIWADVPAYDWVLFCELFGGALHLPDSIHYIVRDLATLFVSRGGDPDVDRFEFAYGKKNAEGNDLARHNALADALAGKVCLHRLLTPNR